MPAESVAIHVLPKSSANKIEGWVEDASGKSWLKVRLTAAPTDGKANTALLKLLAKEWDVPKSALLIVSGEKSRYKTVTINR